MRQGEFSETTVVITDFSLFLDKKITISRAMFFWYDYCK
jgi:hypothetical protein